jgi:hypothetical protein
MRIELVPRSHEQIKPVEPQVTGYAGDLSQTHASKQLGKQQNSHVTLPIYR